MSATVYDGLRDEHVSFEEQSREHLYSMLAVRKMIGLTANCNKVMAIHPPALATCASNSWLHVYSARACWITVSTSWGFAPVICT